MGGLTRDPAEWARESGWVSRIRAERAAERLTRLAFALEGQVDVTCIEELHAVARYLAPKLRVTE